MAWYYIWENPIDIIKIKLLQVTNGFSKVAIYKINTQKSVMFLDTNNELLERENKKTFSLVVASKIIKYLEINLTKDINQSTHWKLRHWWKNLNTKWKISCVHGSEVNIIKMSTLPKAIYI